MLTTQVTYDLETTVWARRQLLRRQEAQLEVNFVLSFFHRGGAALLFHPDQWFLDLKAFSSFAEYNCILIREPLHSHTLFSRRLPEIFNKTRNYLIDGQKWELSSQIFKQVSQAGGGEGGGGGVRLPHLWNCLGAGRLRSWSLVMAVAWLKTWFSLCSTFLVIPRSHEIDRDQLWVRQSRHDEVREGWEEEDEKLK